LDENGNIIEAPFIPAKKRTTGRAKGYKYSEESKKKMREKKALRKLLPDYVPPKLPPHSREIFQYTEQGELIKSYPSIGAAAKDFNGNSRNFKRQIKKSPRNYYKGFIWKYA
jgi:hypothetical protein